MQEKNWGAYSWTVGLLVTGLCLLAFSGFLWLMDGKHPRVFTYIGISLFAIGIVHGIYLHMTDPAPSENEPDNF